MRTRSTAKYGDLAPENVEPLILYGKALLGSAIAQSAVLGGAAPGADEAAAAATGTTNGSASAGDAATAGSSSSAMAATAGSSAAGPSKPNFHFGGDADDDNDDDAEEDAEQAGANDDGDEDEDGGAAAGGDREDDLESAFQVLDMARATLEKEINSAGEAKEEEETGADKLKKEKKERLAEVHRLLGDVATESGAWHWRRFGFSA